jgi:hypothetical protein
MLEQSSLVRRKRGHLLNQVCCAHAVNLAQPGDRTNNDFSLAPRGAPRQLGLCRDVISIRHQTKWGHAVGRCLFTCCRANLWLTPFQVRCGRRGRPGP